MLLSIYTFLEQNFFNSLTKKLTGNVLFLVLIQILMVVSVYYNDSSAVGALQSANVSKEALQAYQTTVQNNHAPLLVLFGLSLAAAVITTFFLRYMVVRPLKNISATFASHDLSQDAPLETWDEIRDVALSTNLFREEMRSVLCETQKMTLQIAAECAK